MRRVLTVYLFTFLLLSPLPSSSQGCRRGTPRPQGMMLHRSTPSSQPKLVGGDFYTGERHQLVVLAAFADQHFKGDETATIEQWNKIFNAENLTESPFYGSVHDYFYAQSYGQFQLTFDLHYVALNGNRSRYRSTLEDDENSQYLVNDIVDVLEHRNIDWSIYDWNQDGYVNQLLIIFAGKGNSYGGFGGGYDAIWPHQWWLSEHLKDGDSSHYCEPRAVSDGKSTYLIDAYCAVQELSSSDNYSTFGTVCHEYSHCFGLPDFYYGSTMFVANWDLMDYGNYNNTGFCPPCYSAHERWLMEWLKPTELTGGTTVSDMEPLSDSPQAFLIRNDGYANEYYMVENRQKKGWDTALPGSGIVIFHIDFDADLWTSTTTVPNTKNRQHYVIFHANNSTSTSTQSRWAYPYNGNNELTDTSSPAATLWNDNANGQKLMSKPITDITVHNDKGAFVFMGGSTGIQATTLTPSAQVLYRFGDISIVRGADGKTQKVIQPKR